MTYSVNGITVIDINRNVTVASANVNANVSFAVSEAFQGTVAGYGSGGGTAGSVWNNAINTIDKFPFASDANSSDVGDLTVSKGSGAGCSSSTHGYNAGGLGLAIQPAIGPPATSNIIDRFLFAVNSNATDVGDLTQPRGPGGSAGMSSTTDGYAAGGYATGSSWSNVIDKFPFSTNTNASDVGDLSQPKDVAAGQSSTTHGYLSGGRFSNYPTTAPDQTNVIERFPFASNGNSTDVGDLLAERGEVGGMSSTTHGYTAGGYGLTTPALPSNYNTIDKFPFATNTNATDVGDLVSLRYHIGGVSSTLSGYAVGGGNGFINTVSNIIEKFPFSTDSNATDVGDMSVSRSWTSGQQD